MVHKILNLMKIVMQDSVVKQFQTNILGASKTGNRG